MTLVYRLLADLTVVVHAAYASTVVLGLLCIILGTIFKWNWIRNFWFRAIHLCMIGVVVAESLFNVPCPLTVWEHKLRLLAGQQTYKGDFIANIVHDLLFYDFPTWVFTTIYCLIGLVIAATFYLAPPRWPWKKTSPLPQS